MRLPFLISGKYFGYLEVEWLVIGEKMGDGFSMYGDIYHYLGPFSAGVYWVLDLLFGKSYLVYHIFGILIVFIQASIFNFFLLNHRAYNDNTYIPSLIYSVLMFTFFDFINLTPALMGMTFVILAFDLTFRHIEGRSKKDWIVLNIGIYLGIATLFYLPLFLFLLSTFIAFVLFTNTMFRRYLLLIYGFFMPIILVFMYYYLRGNFQELVTCFIHPVFMKRGYILMDWQSILFIGIVPTFFVFVSVIKVFTSSSFINYQVRIQSFMIVLIGMGLLVWVIDFYKPPHLWIVLVPSGAFFITHYFLLIKRKWISELMFFVLLFFLLFQNYASYYEILDFNKFINTRNYLVEKKVSMENSSGKKVLSLDYDRTIYLHNKLATPYLSLELSSIQLSNLGYYDNLKKIYSNFNNDPPELIIDTQEWMPGLFDKIPLLEHKYSRKIKNRYVKIE